MAIAHPACASDAAPLARALRVAARSAIGLSAVSPARGRMSHGVERIRQMSSPLVLHRGSCGLETARIAIEKQSDGRHRVSKMMIVMNIEQEEDSEVAPLPADGFGLPKGVRLPMENLVYA